MGVTSLRWVRKTMLCLTLRDEPAEQLPVLAGEILVHQQDVHGCGGSGASWSSTSFAARAAQAQALGWGALGLRTGAYMGRNARTRAPEEHHDTDDPHRMG
jgi:hypothetical protein